MWRIQVKGNRRVMRRGRGHAARPLLSKRGGVSSLSKSSVKRSGGVGRERGRVSGDERRRGRSNTSSPIRIQAGHNPMGSKGVPRSHCSKSGRCLGISKHICSNIYIVVWYISLNRQSSGNGRKIDRAAYSTIVIVAPLRVVRWH